jgi:hypothetical protein
MKFNVFEMPNLIAAGTMYFPISHAKEVIHAFRSYSENADDNKLTLYMLLHVKLTGYVDIHTFFIYPDKVACNSSASLISCL